MQATDSCGGRKKEEVEQCRCLTGKRKSAPGAWVFRIVRFGITGVLVACALASLAALAINMIAMTPTKQVDSMATQDHLVAREFMQGSDCRTLRCRCQMSKKSLGELPEGPGGTVNECVNKN